MTYVQRHLDHQHPTACKHEDSCGLDDSYLSCACAINHTWCFMDCGCNPATCQRVFQGWRCSPCGNSQCPCRQISYDCTDRCGCTSKCRDLSPKFPRFKIGCSKIKSARRGLFAAENIPEGTFLGVYRGVVVLDIEYDSRPRFDNEMTRMALSKCDIAPFNIFWTL